MLGAGVDAICGLVPVFRRARKPGSQFSENRCFQPFFCGQDVKNSPSGAAVVGSRGVTQFRFCHRRGATAPESRKGRGALARVS